MKFLLSIVLSVMVIFSISGCMKQEYIATKTSLELQSMQTKEFESTYTVVFASILSVFQDMGYIIKSADKETGFITSGSPKSQEFVLFVGNSMKQTTATGFIEPIAKNRVKVRLNFVREKETSNGYGMKGGTIMPIEDPKFYQSVFEKVEKAIFVRNNIK